MASTMDTDTRVPLDQASLEVFSARLRDALGNRSITWLQGELEKAEVDGSGYSNVQRYVAGKEGKSLPSPTWLQGAAKLLGVRPAWLAFGDGARTETVELKRVLRARALERGEALDRATEAALRKGLGRDPLPNSFDSALRCMNAYFAVAPVEKIGPNLAREVGRAIAAPMKNLEFNPPDFTQESYDHYVAAVAESLRFLIAQMPDPNGEED